MRKILSIFSLAILTVGLLCSCSKINERIDGLDKRIYDLENDKIASVEQQITAIKESIADLETIRTNIQTLIEAKTTQGEDITKLKEADQTLEGKINDLNDYVNTELAKYATKDWANATFATLAKQDEIITDVEKLKQDLAGLDDKLDQAIANLDSTLKSWVNEQLSGYYTVAEINAKIDDLKSDIDALEGNNETNKDKIEELETSLSQLKQDLATVKADIKTAYEKAIKEAIEGNDGYITETIKDSIDEANGKITDLTGRVETLESDVATLKADVAALKAMIQTVSIIPAYSDGSVKAEGGILTINCVITPKKAVENLTKKDFTIFTSVCEVLTKSALYGTIAIAKDDDLVLDKVNGTATIKVDVSSALPTEEGKALTIAVNIKNGISDFSTEFVPVTVTKKPIKTIADVLATVVGGFPNTPDQNDIPNNAWTNGNNVYAYIYSKENQAALILRDSDSARIINSITTVTPGENCYTTSVANGDLTFKMTNGILTSFEYIATNVKHECDGTYDTEKTTLTMKKGDTEYDWNKITISIKGIDIVSGKYYFGKSTVENAAGDFIELTAEQIGSINSAEGLHIVKEDLDAETEYKTVLVVSNSAGYLKTIVATENSGEAPPPM